MSGAFCVVAAAGGGSVWRCGFFIFPDGSSLSARAIRRSAFFLAAFARASNVNLAIYVFFS